MSSFDFILVYQEPRGNRNWECGRRGGMLNVVWCDGGGSVRAGAMTALVGWALGSTLMLSGAAFMRAPTGAAPVPPPPMTIATSRADAVGHAVMVAVIHGQSAAGVVVKRLGTNLWVRQLFSKTSAYTLFELAPNAVIWRGGWQFVGQAPLRQLAVELVLRHHQVLGVLAYHDDYGRVLRRQGDWVTLRRVWGKRGTDPACRVPVGRPFRARIIHDTVWNSRRYLLPRHSLVQYTVYGVPGYPFLLGGVEDYGRAPCPPRR